MRAFLGTRRKKGFLSEARMMASFARRPVFFMV